MNLTIMISVETGRIFDVSDPILTIFDKHKPQGVVPHNIQTENRKGFSVAICAYNNVRKIF